MHISLETLVLGALAAGQATAATMHGKQHNHAARHAEILKSHHESRSIKARNTNLLSATEASLLTNLGFTSTGTNAVAAGNIPWIGEGGPYTNEFINQSGEDMVMVIWGSWGSWVNAVKPQITVSVPANGSQIVSFPIGWSGAWAPVHSASKLVNGQISDTWGEATFAPPYSVFDVSREVNMNGQSMKIVGPKCTSDMDQCVFKCTGGATTCLTGYELVNCSTDKQAGANFGFYQGAASGGCGGMDDTANIKTYLGYQ